MKCLLLLSILGLAVALPYYSDKSAYCIVRYQASLNIGYHFCSGALISLQWVLSAAHCYNPTLKVILGEYRLDMNDATEQSFKYANIIPHQGYNRFTFDNDIMLIKLSRPANTDNNRVAPISLPTECPPVGTTCRVPGWNVKACSRDVLPNSTYCEDLELETNDACKEMYPGQVKDNMGCMRYITTVREMPCQGDSGGPVNCNNELHGIVSWGRQCPRPLNGLVFTKVCLYLTWIQDNMAQNEAQQ